MSILIGQYYGTSLVSKAIKLKTWSEISHTSAFLPGGEEVIEAWGKGVIRRPWREGHTEGTRIDLLEVKCSPEQAQAFYLFLYSQIGKEYDFKGIMGFAFSSGIHNKEKWFCSELVFAAALHAGIVLLERIEAHKVSPGLIHCTPLGKLIKTIYV